MGRARDERFCWWPSSSRSLWRADHAVVPDIPRNAGISCAAMDDRADKRVIEAVISPDGLHVPIQRSGVVDSGPGSKQPRKLAEEDGICGLCRSPQSDFVVFGKLTVYEEGVGSGRPHRDPVELPGGFAQRPNWSSDGRSVVFANGFPARLYEVPAGGGEARLLFQVDASESRTRFRIPTSCPMRASGAGFFSSPARRKVPRLLHRIWRPADGRF